MTPMKNQSVLTTALAEINQEVSERNVARVKGEIGVIQDCKSQIRALEKTIADSQKAIRGFDSEAPLSARDVAGK